MHSTQNLATFAQNLGLLCGRTPTLEALVKELQGFRCSLVDGAGANTNIPITGIKTSDTLKFVLELPASYDLSTILDRTSIASITSAGNIQLTSTTASNKLLVVWYSQDGLFTVSAGPDQTVNDDDAQLAGVMSPVFRGATFLWEYIDAPIGESVSFDDETILNAVATMTGLGVFTLRLTVTLGSIKVSDTVVITNEAP